MKDQNEYLSILKFWFGDDLGAIGSDSYKHRSKLWFQTKGETDELITNKFGETLLKAERGELDHWCKDVKGCIALIILLDQFSRNIYRGSAGMFKNDAKASSIAKDLMKRSDFEQLALVEKFFTYLCLLHCEDEPTARHALELIQELTKQASQAQRPHYIQIYQSFKSHHEMLAKFGRYPHRNIVLGRESTPEETEYLMNSNQSFVRSVLPVKKPVSANFELQTRKKPESKKTTATVNDSAKYLPAQKILFLHGFRQNANKLKKRTNKLTSALSQQSNTKVRFLNGTHPYMPKGEIVDQLKNTFGDDAVNPIESQRIWFNTDDEALYYENIEESISHVVSHATIYGPYDGICGFGQGAVVATIVARKYPHLFRYIILISAFRPRSLKYKDLLSPESQFDFPSFHTYGVTDVLITPNRSAELTSCFKTPVVVEHQSGHFAPDAWPIDQLCSFVISMGQLQASSLIKNPRLDISLLSKVSEINHKLIRYDIDNIDLQDLFQSSLEADLAGIDFAKFPTQQELFDKVKSALNDSPSHLDQKLLFIYVLWARASKFETENKKTVDFTSLPLESLHSYTVMKLFLWLYLTNLPQREYFLHTVINIMYIDSDRWRELIYLSDLCFNLKTSSDFLSLFGKTADVAQELNDLYSFLINLFAQQIVLDLKQLDNKQNSKKLAELVSIDLTTFKLDENKLYANENGFLSDLSKHLPRVKSSIDKRSRIAREIAKILNKYDESSTDKDKIISYNHYRKCLTAICFYNDERKKSMEIDSNPRSKLFIARYDRSAFEKLASAPLSDAIVNPVPEPVDISSHEQMRPLYEWLEENRLKEKVEKNYADLQFLRGTVTGDGRLDLCKQVIGPKGIHPLLNAMEENVHVDRILLGNNVMGDEAGQAISNFIKSGKSKIIIWYIAGNNLTAKGIEPICDALSNDTQVKGLWLKRNPLKAGGMIHIGNLLRHNSTIQTLDLLNCGLLDAGVKILFESLVDNTALRHLYLSANGITPTGLISVRDYYKTGKSQLQTLFLGCNRIGDEGAQHVAECLRHDKCLQSLNLASSRIESEGMKHLSQALVTHTTLRVLDMGYMRATLDLGELGNCIGNMGASFLSTYLAQTQTLLSLNITHNQIKQRGMQYLVAAIKKNKSLVSFDYIQYGESLNEITLTEMRQALQRNRELMSQQLDIESILVPEHVREIYSVYRTH